MSSGHAQLSSTGRIVDFWSLMKSYHAFIADVTNARFYVDEDEECHVDPPSEEFDLCVSAAAETTVQTQNT